MSDRPLLIRSALTEEVTRPLGSGTKSPVPPESSKKPGTSASRVVVKSSGRNYGSFTKTACVDSYFQHPIQKGETLQAISIKYNISIEQLKRVNKLRVDSDYYLKDYILIPCPDVIPVDIGLVSQDGAVTPLDEIQAIEPKNRSQSANKKGDGSSQNKNPPSPTIDDIFSRFDSSFAVTKSKVEKLAQSSSFTPITTPSHSGSEDSLSTKVKSGRGSSSPRMTIRTGNGTAKQRSGNEVLLESQTHDDFYEL